MHIAFIHHHPHYVVLHGYDKEEVDVKGPDTGPSFQGKTDRLLKMRLLKKQQIGSGS